MLCVQTKLLLLDYASMADLRTSKVGMMTIMNMMNCVFRYYYVAILLLQNSNTQFQFEYFMTVDDFNLKKIVVVQSAQYNHITMIFNQSTLKLMNYHYLKAQRTR